MIDIIRGLQPAANPLPKHYWVLDSETAGLYGKPLIICILRNDGFHKEFDGDDCGAQFKTYVKSHISKFAGTTVFIHNLEFDLSKIFGNVLQNKNLNVLMAGSRFISAKWTIKIEKRNNRTDVKKNVNFIDTFNISQSKLSKMGDSLGFDKYETPKKFFKNNLQASEITNTDIEYCKRDCEVLMKWVKNLGDLLKPFKVRLRSTVAANAKSIWRRVYLDKDIYVQIDEDEKFRDAYYGGRVEVFYSKPNKKLLYHYDVNSLYPSVMKNNLFPNPAKLKTFKNINTEIFINRVLKTREGCATVKMICPPSLSIPLLPIRHKNGLVFPVGKIEGCYCFPELRRALEVGYELIEVSESTHAPPMDSPYTSYINIFEDMKVKATLNNDEATRTFAKYMQNSLYGKFAQRNPTEEQYVHEEPTEGIYQTFGNVYRINNIEKERGTGTCVCWASYVTSYAKVALFEYLNINPKAVHYCDTDSVFTEKPLPKDMVHPTKYGKMDLEDMVLESYFIDPKKYVITTDAQKTKVIMKGIPEAQRKDLSISKLDVDSIGFEYNKPYKTKTAARYGVDAYSLQKIQKVLTRHGTPKRIFHEKGTSKPIEIYSFRCENID